MFNDLGGANHAGFRCSDYYINDLFLRSAQGPVISITELAIYLQEMHKGE